MSIADRGGASMSDHHRLRTGRSRPILALAAVLALALVACQGASSPAPDGKSGKLKVFGAFATQIEEPWDGVIHSALEAEKAAGGARRVPARRSRTPPSSTTGPPSPPTSPA